MLRFKITTVQFLSTPSGWRATRSVFGFRPIRQFLSTPSGWRATQVLPTRGAIFLFLSTPSGWRATSGNSDFIQHVSISIHALRVEGDVAELLELIVNHISIHALRVEGDRQQPGGQKTEAYISIHALRVEGDVTDNQKLAVLTIFLSTPSGWRVTRAQVPPLRRAHYFYPRPPGGG